jgi:6-pyruvoyltetrahydropterin/6-carboxytetrahydropterin synthase
LFTISVETQFRAGHQLAQDDGSMEPTHEHNWVVTAYVSSDRLNTVGVVMDFNRLKAAIDRVAAKFDNVLLNSSGCFDGDNPSAENIARYVYEKLEPQLPAGVRLERVIVAEEPGCKAEFRTD